MVAAAAAVGLLTGLVAGGAAAPAAGAPKPAYSVSAGLTRTCELKIMAEWARGEPVAQVFAVISTPTGGTITMAAPGGPPNGGTIKGQRATFVAGPFVAATTVQVWGVRADFYAAAGNLLSQQTTSTTGPCTVAVAP
ncbi:MAG TPA: hypothetical protein VFO65_04085 [Acidimicrobiales bacterium]|nr:hypothetical protein [Acidimicrobiales bacterium]